MDRKQFIKNSLKYMCAALIIGLFFILISSEYGLNCLIVGCILSGVGALGIFLSGHALYKELSQNVEKEK